jgi:transcriptional regulator with XRE-family HTH domain
MATAMYSLPTTSDLRDRLAAAFQRAMRTSRSPAKELARRIGVSPGCATMLLRGETMPRGDTLLVACREFDAVWAEVQAITRREPGEAELVLDELVRRLQERRR